MKSITQENSSIAILIILHLVGIIGYGLSDQFVLLTPINLCLSLLVVLWNHPRNINKLSIFVLICFLVGFGAEMLGVQTGLLFGDYYYGEVLGYKINGTPLMIGINWALVTYCSAMVVNQFMEQLPFIFKSLAGTFLLVFLDYFIEPVAIKYEFWFWHNDIVPLKNYIGWAIVGFPLHCLFQILIGNRKNKVAVILFIIQFLFFLILGTR